MRKVFLLTNVARFKYFTRNKASNGGYEIFCGDLSNKKMLKLDIT